MGVAWNAPKECLFIHVENCINVLVHGLHTHQTLTWVLGAGGTGPGGSGAGFRSSALTSWLLGKDLFSFWLRHAPSSSPRLGSPSSRSPPQTPICLHFCNRSLCQQALFQIFLIFICTCFPIATLIGSASCRLGRFRTLPVG